jgi:hypothetical protein
MGLERFGPLHCDLCKGAECRGGGNLTCVQRDPRPSKVACILDSYGGSRVVIDYNPKTHARPDEIVVLVKGLRIHEPLAWGDIPGCVGRAEHELKEWVHRNSGTNDALKREAIQWWKFRRSEQWQRSLHLPDICFT